MLVALSWEHDVLVPGKVWFLGMVSIGLSALHADSNSRNFTSISRFTLT